MVTVIEAVNHPQNVIVGTPSLFLAGGISGCSDWQADLIDRLKVQMSDQQANYGFQENVVIYNPRRADFPIHDPDAAKDQIEWEYEYLQKASAILFWFAPETFNPIVLYELGFYLGKHYAASEKFPQKPLFIGVHPEYARKNDVIIQTKLSGHKGKVALTFHDLTEQVISWLNPY